jgi:7-carboxy-7-deazaguanine synthase
MRISEIFTSIQGESTHAGRPCTFVRTTGCDQRCVWCDTAHAFEGGTDYTLEDLYGEVAARAVPLVELTGGEPLLQPDALPFLAGLCDRGYAVLLETGGSLPIQGVDPRVQRILDLKCPASGMTDHIHWENLDALRPGDEVKFVIADRGDYEWARDLVAAHRLSDRVPVLLSPAHGVLEPRPLAEWLLADGHGFGPAARLQLQAHKYIWSPEMRGV